MDFGIPIDFNVAALVAAPVFLITAFIEEVGWRGFALPDFLSRYSPARSGLLLGIIWAIWHAPDYLREPFALYAALFATLIIILTTQSIVMTWIFQQAGGVILPVVLLHAISNVMGAMFFNGDYSVVAMTTFLQVRIAVSLVMLIVAGALLIYDGGTRAHFQSDNDRQAKAATSGDAA